MWGLGLGRAKVPGDMVIRILRTWDNSKLKLHPCSRQNKDVFITKMSLLNLTHFIFLFVHLNSRFMALI